MGAIIAADTMSAPEKTDATSLLDFSAAAND